uniref:PIN domain-containing protein n=1 Tax=Sinocyclocheilus rhinocerous TaxID=307959 RepID=A0A673LD58_9TELE
MLKSKTFVKKTRAGGVLKIVREHYLRDDIWCGSQVCMECKDEAPVLQEDASIESNLCSYPHYLIPDTNVVLHQRTSCLMYAMSLNTKYIYYTLKRQGFRLFYITFIHSKLKV